MRSSFWRLESFDDAGEGEGDGDGVVLLTGIDGDGSSDSERFIVLRILSNISPITINDGSTIYWIKP
jgi:hypothetical protein